MPQSPLTKKSVGVFIVHLFIPYIFVYFLPLKAGVRSRGNIVLVDVQTFFAIVSLGLLLELLKYIKTPKQNFVILKYVLVRDFAAGVYQSL